ncbi:gamma-glutamylcyclotransferase family protein [Novosphingopyxis sp. YJ-S2-01]|uniref:gamma-glutamylcyclotransferase family protein n=1 Tax=Novosphingopyxis sp. YJ-S2-01 TaxID=2794021 RepID=UPI0018DBFD51|nr:gamma-glutamylcyclotransferase family protein [Novosphingopyxis sp. YJ-S2-01]MBH9537984.1 gamma-glutamylcyclotransferase [Novosphingopyxis sp. YJ-S2-01]
MTGQTGFADLQLHDKLTSIGRDSVSGRLYDCGGYPGLILGEGTPVHGEVFRVTDEAVWTALDRFEDYNPHDPSGSLYIRRQVTTSGRREVWLYEYNFDVASLPDIGGGDWRTWRSR